jgi:hypothetical protein
MIEEDVILRSGHLAASRRMAAGTFSSHPSRLAKEARTSSDNGKAVTPG